jgi:hypothetical protein
MNDRIVIVLPTHFPSLCASAPEQGTEIIGVNQDPCIHSQSDHLLWRIGVIELVLNRRVTIHQMAEVIQRIQKRLRVGVHAAEAGETERYSGDGFRNT